MPRSCCEHSPSLQPLNFVSTIIHRGIRVSVLACAFCSCHDWSCGKSWPSQVIITSLDRVGNLVCMRAVLSLSRLVEPTRQAGRVMPFFSQKSGLSSPAERAAHACEDFETSVAQLSSVQFLRHDVCSSRLGDVCREMPEVTSKWSSICSAWHFQFFIQPSKCSQTETMLSWQAPIIWWW